MMLFALAGCVIAGPPDYQDPAQTPPVLDLSQASPALLDVITAYSSANSQPTTTIQISVPVRSEDAGEELAGLLFLDYGRTGQLLQPGLWRSPPSTFDDKRVVSLPWSAASQPQGCHTLTLAVTHSPNVNAATGQITLPQDHSDDIALATWWVNIDPVDPNVLENCPSGTQGQ